MSYNLNNIFGGEHLKEFSLSLESDKIPEDIQKASRIIAYLYMLNERDKLSHESSQFLKSSDCFQRILNIIREENKGYNLKHLIREEMAKITEERKKLDNTTNGILHEINEKMQSMTEKYIKSENRLHEKFEEVREKVNSFHLFVSEINVLISEIKNVNPDEIVNNVERRLFEILIRIKEQLLERITSVENNTGETTFLLKEQIKAFYEKEAEELGMKFETLEEEAEERLKKDLKKTITEETNEIKQSFIKQIENDLW